MCNSLDNACTVAVLRDEFLCVSCWCIWIWRVSDPYKNQVYLPLNHIYLIAGIFVVLVEFVAHIIIIVQLEALD